MIAETIRNLEHYKQFKRLAEAQGMTLTGEQYDLLRQEIFKSMPNTGGFMGSLTRAAAVSHVVKEDGIKVDRPKIEVDHGNFSLVN
jgi:hypothetical protein